MLQTNDVQVGRVALRLDSRSCKTCKAETSHMWSLSRRRWECLECDGGRPATRECERCKGYFSGDYCCKCFLACRAHGPYLRPSWPAGCPVCSANSYEIRRVREGVGKGIAWLVWAAVFAPIGAALVVPGWTAALIPASIWDGFIRWFPTWNLWAIGLAIASALFLWVFTRDN